MAIEQRVYDISLVSQEDLSDSQYYWMAGLAAFGCDIAGDADEDLVGILQNKPVSGRAAEVRRVGISKMICGGTISAWNKVTSDADGKGVVASDVERYGAIALEAGVENRIISVLMEFGYVEMT